MKTNYYFNIAIDVYNPMIKPAIGQGRRVFANSLGDRSSIPGQVIPKKILKWYLIPPCLTWYLLAYKVRIKGNVEQSRERSSALPYTSVS